MRQTTATDDNVFDFQALLHPGTVFEHPKDVVMHPSLTLAEKRAILASWASDASAIASCPALRAPEGLNAPVSIDAILEALCELDGGPRNPPGGKPQRRFSTARAGRLKVRGRNPSTRQVHVGRWAAFRNHPFHSAGGARSPWLVEPACKVSRDGRRQPLHFLPAQRTPSQARSEVEDIGGALLGPVRFLSSLA